MKLRKKTIATALAMYAAFAPAVSHADVTASRSAVCASGSWLDTTITAVEREKYVYTFFLRQGLTATQAAAAVGNFEAEGSRGRNILDPSILGGWKGRALGIGQWLGPRKQQLLALAGARGIDLLDCRVPFWTRLRTELDFVMMEFNSGESAAWDELRSAKTLENAVDAMAHYERWSGWQAGRAGAEAGSHYSIADRIAARAHAGLYD